MLTGSDDPISADGLADFVRGLARVQHFVVNGAHHDVLNDVRHRSVGVTVVTFLERLRQPNPGEEIVRITHSAW